MGADVLVDARSRGISNHVIDYVEPNEFGPCKQILRNLHDDMMPWRDVLHYWPPVKGIH